MCLYLHADGWSNVAFIFSGLALGVKSVLLCDWVQVTGACAGGPSLPYLLWLPFPLVFLGFVLGSLLSCLRLATALLVCLPLIALHGLHAP